ncbi:hypothetical protein ACODM8_06705 [Vibrio ostreicida]|uniref:Uncharacterized protein n=1 Tax=Vibrio ostreicida TaxID=526588 RepID=A0ABT8BWK3_9VIBR|nr:hypothetical protein [Vibrio ostreicida]MDN3610769.1 hypothetical protein [Vibrio ostreicida]NPD07236.1 hypothetical protein [Vibrio ostreicida]
MKKKIALICFVTCLSAQTQAENNPEIFDATPEGVLTKFESMHQVRDRMKQDGYTQHRCGIQSIKQGTPAQQQAETPHSQIQCFYSKPGALPSEESELAYWHLNIAYNSQSKLYKAGNEFTDYYQTHIYTHEPLYLLDAGPHYYSERARLQAMGMTIGECNLQQIYYFMKPTESTYLSHVASCPVYQAEGELSGHIKVEIDYTSDNMGYSEKSVNFVSL